jgi:hypothetical protein
LRGAIGRRGEVASRKDLEDVSPVERGRVCHGGPWLSPRYHRSLRVSVEGIEVHIPSLDDLIRNKKAMGRPRDLADAEALEPLKNSK